MPLWHDALSSVRLLALTVLWIGSNSEAPRVGILPDHRRIVVATPDWPMWAASRASRTMRETATLGTSYHSDHTDVGNECSLPFCSLLPSALYKKEDVGMHVRIQDGHACGMREQQAVSAWPVSVGRAKGRMVRTWERRSTKVRPGL